MNIVKRLSLISTMTLPLFLTACSPAPPKNPNNICSIFREYPSWYWDAQEVRNRWGIPISTLMAIIHQESHFQAGAAPPREKILWIIPWKRPTSAYGYSQAVDGTWKLYKQQTGGGFFTSRDDFGNAADFIGWYAHRAHEQARIAMNNTYAQYLAYHEGIGGYIRGSYRKKEWLINVARKVQRQSWTYHWQLSRCESSLPKKPWWHVW